MNHTVYIISRIYLVIQSLCNWIEVVGWEVPELPPKKSGTAEPFDRRSCEGFFQPTLGILSAMLVNS